MNPLVAQKIEDFFSPFPVRQYPAGHVLLAAHDNPQHIFHLLEGRIKQYDITPGGDEIVLNVFKPPAFFPMSYAMNQTPNVYFYEAETDTSLRLAPIPDVLEFIKANPDVLYDLLARVYRGTDGLIGRLAHLMGGSAQSRVLYELLIEARRFGHPRGQGVVIVLSESDVAARAGLARETVSREIAKLKKAGLIAVIKHEIFVNHVDDLAAAVSREL